MAVDEEFSAVYASYKSTDGKTYTRWGVYHPDYGFAPFGNDADSVERTANRFREGYSDPAGYTWVWDYKMRTDTPDDMPDRATFASGMVRDVSTDKPRFDLLVPAEQSYEETMLHRWAKHMAAGAARYSDRNWEKANSDEEYQRFRESAFRHFMQWFAGEDDEDHAAAVFFNITGAEYTKGRMS